MTAGRPCDDCEIVWPATLEYRTCPGCNQSMVSVPGVHPTYGPNVSMQKAMDMTSDRHRREAFERFCAERDAPLIDAECEKFKAELDAFVGVAA